MRVPQELGTPWLFHLFDLLAWWGGARPKTSWPPVGVGPGRSENRREGWSPSCEGNEVRRAGRQGIGAPHSTVEAGERVPPGPWGGKGVPWSWTVGGKHVECIGTRSRVNETTTDSRTGEAISAHGIHLPGSPHRPGLAARGLPAHAAGRGAGRGRTNDPRLQQEPAGQPAVAVGAGEIRDVPGSAGATGAHSERHGFRDPADRYPDFRRHAPPPGARHGAARGRRGGL